MAATALDDHVLVLLQDHVAALVEVEHAEDNQSYNEMIKGLIKELHKKYCFLLFQFSILSCFFTKKS